MRTCSEIFWSYFSFTNRDYLLGLRGCPKHRSNVPRTPLTTWACSTVALKNSKLSSANKRCDTLEALRQTFTPSKRPRLSLCFKRVDKPSATSKNKYAESGSPCRRPRDGEKECESTPLKRPSSVQLKHKSWSTVPIDSESPASPTKRVFSCWGEKF
jgi:hypothetical protein